MTEDLRWTVSPGPHLSSPEQVSTIMFRVAAALIPALLVGVVQFGWPAVRVIIFSVGSCLAAEALSLKIRSRPISLADGSALVTGLLLAMNLPPSAPWWLATVGGGVAIVIAKQAYGGLGNNPFNPALAARVVLLVSWPSLMTSWTAPRLALHKIEALTSATPLGLIKTEVMTQGHLTAGKQLPLLDMLLGGVGGSLGEISAAALILGGLYLLVTRVIDPEIPVFFLGTVAVFGGIFWVIDPGKYPDPLIHLLGGGLMLGALFMATDPVTSPITRKGRIFFGIGCGLITVLIRLFGGYPEGVSFAILLMNGTTPLIDRWVRPRRFGGIKK